MKSLPALLAVALAVLAGGIWSQHDRIAETVIRKTALASLGADTLAKLPEGLHAGFCGTGSPMTDPMRSGPCTVVIAGRHVFLVDAGRGSADILSRMGLSPGRIETVLLTHFHSDHIDGLGQLAEQVWVTGATTHPLKVLAPQGVQDVVEGFNKAYAANGRYRTAHHGRAIANPDGYGMVAMPFTLDAGQKSLKVLDMDGVRITAFQVNHGPVHPAVGYRFDYAGRSLTISGDTAESPELVIASQGVDLMIHEALSRRMVGLIESEGRMAGNTVAAHIMHDIPDYHSDPEMVAREANSAQVGALAFTHIIPRLPSHLLEPFFLGRARQIFEGPMFVARDGDLISLPANGDPLKRSNILRK